MSNKLRLYTKRFFIFSNIAIVIIFLLACLAPYLNPQEWWLISFLGLGFPILLFLVILFLIGWLIVLKPRLSIISAVALLLGIKSISVFFAINSPTTFKEEKAPHSIRIATWNVARFVELKVSNNKGSQIRKQMLDQIKQQNADILCMQEFHTANNLRPEFYDNITPIQKELGYPYYYFSYDTDGDNLFYSSIIFSRYPIIDSSSVRYPRPTLTDVLLRADIKVNNDTIRVYTTHLQSLQFGKGDYLSMQKIKEGDSLLAGSRGILGKIKRGLIARSIQARVVESVLAVNPLPAIFCADLNDIPNSYTYRKVKGNMQDAFLEKGFGIGRTFTGISPTLRIDYILADKRFAIQQFKRITKKLSDHYMLVADVELKK